MTHSVSLFTKCRSILFAIVFALLTIVLGTLALLAGLVSKRLAYGVTRFWANCVMGSLRISCGLRYQVTGLEHIPNTPCVFLTQHQATWETIAQICFLPKHTWVLKKELLIIPFFGWVLSRCLMPIAIDRKQRKQAMQQVLEQGAKRIQQGYSVMIFPEGTRRAVGDVGRCAKSGPILALNQGCPVVRIRHNAGKFWLKQRWWRLPGTIEVHIAPPLETHNATLEYLQHETLNWFRQQN